MTGRERIPHRRPFYFHLILACVSVGITAATIEAASYAYFRIRERAGTDLRIFAPAMPPSGMPLAVKTNFSQVWATGDFTVHIRTNSLGLREDFDLPPSKVDIAFLGDSFTFGQGVEAGERYSDRLRELLGDRLVASYSYVNGWAPPHYYLFLREHPELIPRIAVLGLCLANDLTSDIAESELIYSDAGELTRVKARWREANPLGQLVSIDQNPVNRMLRRAWSGRLLLHLDQQLGLQLPFLHPRPTPGLSPIDQIHLGVLPATSQVALDYVDKIAQLMRQDGGDLIVFLIPEGVYVGPYNHLFAPKLSEDIRTNLYLMKALQGWCTSHHIVCIDPIADFRAEEDAGRRLYFPNDPHWTAAGHQKAADILWHEIRERDLPRS